MGPKGRTIIPASARRTAGIVEGQELTVLIEGRGRFRLATREALQEEAWAAAPENNAASGAVADVRAMRNRDNRFADAAAQCGTGHRARGQGGIDSLGADLMRELGLDPGS